MFSTVKQILKNTRCSLFPSGIIFRLFEELCLAILLEQVWCNKCSCFSYSDSVFISPSLLKDILLNILFWVDSFFLSTLKMVCHFLINVMISNEKSAVIWMVVSLYVMCHFLWLLSFWASEICRLCPSLNLVSFQLLVLQIFLIFCTLFYAFWTPITRTQTFLYFPTGPCSFCDWTHAVSFYSLLYFYFKIITYSFIISSSSIRRLSPHLFQVCSPLLRALL